jgi:AcrR family transcriptional regulator
MARTDPRIAQTRRAVLHATLQLIAERGFQGATIERVAEVSGVARSTIYRRWGDVDRLFLDAFDEITRPTPLPLTDDLASDLRTFARGYARELNDPAFHDVVMFLMDMALRSRGDRTGYPDTDPKATADAVMAPLFYQRVARHMLPSSTDADEAVARALAGLEPRARPRATSSRSA